MHGQCPPGQLSPTGCEVDRTSLRQEGCVWSLVTSLGALETLHGARSQDAGVCMSLRWTQDCAKIS